MFKVLGITNQFIIACQFSSKGLIDFNLKHDDLVMSLGLWLLLEKVAK
jgi:hypothetical protein